MKEMNPLADVRCHTEPVSQMSDDFFRDFDIICASDMDRDSIVSHPVTMAALNTDRRSGP